MMIFLIIVGVIVTRFLYQRYVPVAGLSCVQLEKIEQDDVIILDVRDSSIADKLQVVGAVNIPLAYMKRNSYLFKGKSIYIIGSDRIDINLSARLLKSNGVKVKGYHLKNVQSTRFNCKREEIHGIH